MDPMNPDRQIHEILEQCRGKLLDLGTRNRLLSLRQSGRPRHDYIRVVDELPSQLYERLSSEKKMIFEPKEPEESSLLSSEESPHSGESSFDLPLPMENMQDIPNRHSDSAIGTPYELLELNRRLKRIYREKKRYQEERGVDVLFAMFGFIEWEESGSSSSKSHEAPLLLLPLEIERKRKQPKSEYSILGSGAAAINMTLQERMNRDFGIHLPDFPSESENFSLESYFSQIEEAVKEHTGIHFRRWVTIGILPFSKISMWKDLDPNNWKGISRHPVIGELFGGRVSRDAPTSDEIPADDGIIRAGNCLDLPLPTDASQRWVVRQGLSKPVLVVRGPPGTGKSQTIANLICASIAAEEKVLFVAEKAVAISVVQRRLEQANLGNFTLMIESDAIRPKQLLDSVRARIDYSPPSGSRSLDDLRLERDRKESTLRKYDETVNRHVPILEEPYGQLVHRYDTLRRLMGDITIPFSLDLDILNLNLTRLDSAERRAKELAEHISENPQSSNPDPWSWVRKIHPGVENEIKTLLKQYDSRWYNILLTWNRGRNFLRFAKSLGIYNFDSHNFENLAKSLEQKKTGHLTPWSRPKIIKKWLQELQNSEPTVLSWWERRIEIEEELLDYGFHGLVEALRQEKLPAFHAANAVWMAVCMPLFEKFKGNFLASSSRKLETSVKEFTELNDKIEKITGVELAKSLSNVLIPRGPSSSRKRNLRDKRLLDYEITKKTRHLPIRELVKRADQALHKLMPVWMMSPLSVASFLKRPSPGRPTFDLVILDEASQQRPEEALGALLRGKRAVIVGDENQLPPTAFFQTGENEEEDDEGAGLESILDLARARVSDDQKAQLLWHYRSKHRGLVQFSNRKFYDNSLFIPPCLCADQEPCGVSHRYIENAYYKKGLNPIEKDAIIEEVCRHIQENPKQSLGIVTMNKKQADLISDGLQEIEARRGSLAETYLNFLNSHEISEPLFVKALENVQGDERDVILVGTLYGPDEESGKIFQRFGPVNNKDYGHRRINVLVTRAKQHLRIVTSMKPADIRSTENMGPNVLREYIEYAKTHQLPPLAGDSQGNFESPFEESVGNFLKQNNFKIATQVGVEGFRIDIVAYDRSSPSRVIAGVECDGARYHSSMDARDRDSLRQKILESRGWNILRVWGTDWFRDRSQAEEKLLDSLKQLEQNNTARRTE